MLRRDMRWDGSPGHCGEREFDLRVDGEPIVNVSAAPWTAQTTFKAKGYEGEMCRECGNFTLVPNGTRMRCDVRKYNRVLLIMMGVQHSLDT